MEEGVYVIVAFRVTKENSVYYKKCKSLEELLKAVSTSFKCKKADFISIRWIRREREVSRDE